LNPFPGKFAQEPKRRLDEGQFLLSFTSLGQ